MGFMETIQQWRFERQIHHAKRRPMDLRTQVAHMLGDGYGYYPPDQTLDHIAQALTAQRLDLDTPEGTHAMWDALREAEDATATATATDLTKETATRPLPLAILNTSILTAEQVEEIGYSIKVLTRTA